MHRSVFVALLALAALPQPSIGQTATEGASGAVASERTSTRELVRRTRAGDAHAADLLGARLAPATAGSSASASRQIETHTVFLYAPSVGAGSQPALGPVDVPNTRRARQAERSRMPPTGSVDVPLEHSVAAELPEIVRIIAPLIGRAGGPGIGADAIVARLTASGDVSNTPDGDVFPSSIRRWTQHCGGKGAQLAEMTYCRRATGSFDQVVIDSFGMWQSITNKTCGDCTARYAERNRPFTLDALTRQLAAIGYIDGGPVGTPDRLLGMLTPSNRLFTSQGPGPLLVVQHDTPQAPGNASYVRRIVMFFSHDD